jgi:hypothetical protein
MPKTRIILSKDKEGCKGKYAVVSSDSGRILGCHAKRGDAINQMRAIYAQQSGQKK